MAKNLDLSKCEIPQTLPDDWKEKAKKIFEEGGDVKNVIVALGITKKQHETFLLEEGYKDVIDNGMIHSEAYWLDWAKRNVDNKNVNTALFNTMTSRMFNWDKKVEKDKDRKKKDEKEKKVTSYLDRYTKKSDKEITQ